MRRERSRRSCKEKPLSGLDDPVLLLKNEHAVMLAQLRILEQCIKPGEQTSDVLKALIRDGAVHFRREVCLLKALEPRLGTNGQTLRRLVREHHALKHWARELLHESMVVRGDMRSPRWSGLRRRLREFTEHFRDHIRHEETIIFVLVQMRLKLKQRKRIASQLLAV